MFGSRNRNVFTPTSYGGRRKKRIPGWLILLISGIAIGSGGLLFLQKNYGPTRLTVEQSEQLQIDLNSANIESQKLTSELNQVNRQLEESQDSLAQRENELEKLKNRLSNIDNELAILIDAIPADPRGSNPGIRAANFSNQDGKLAYKVLVMQEANQETGKIETFKGTAQVIVTGNYTNGVTSHQDLEPFEFEVDEYTQLSGLLDLPNHYIARQATIKLTREGEKRVSATRTLNVR